MRSTSWRLINLESRITPTVVQWDGGPTGNGTDWHDAANWQGDVIPTNNDSVQIVATGSNPTIEVGANAAVGFITSNRSINLKSGGLLSIGPGGSILPTLNLTGGTVELQDGVELSNTVFQGTGTVEIGAGRTVKLVWCTFEVPLIVNGKLMIQEDIVANDGLTVNGMLHIIGDSAPTTLTVDGKVNNSGVIDLTSIEQSQTSRLKISNGTLTNAASGQINLSLGTGGTRDIQLANSSTHFINHGSLRIQSDSTISRIGSGQTFTHDGLLEIEGNQTLTINASTTIGGGTITGGGTMTVGTLQINSNINMQLASVTLGGLTGSGQWTIPATTTVKTNNNTNLQCAIHNFGTLVIRGSSSIGTGFVSQPGSTIRVQGEPGIGTATLHSTATVTNNGLLEITSATSTNTASLVIDSGPFINSASGTISVLTGAGGTRNMNVLFAGSFTNQGTLSVDSNLSWSGQPLNTSGKLSVASGKTLTTTATVINNTGGVVSGIGTIKSAGLSGAGTISPGTPAGTLTSNGSVNHSGKLTNNLDGASQFDQLKVLGAVTLSGPLEVAVNYAAQVGDEFVIVDNDGSDSITGTFTSLEDGKVFKAQGVMFEIDYQGGTGNDVTIKAVTVGPPPSDASIVVNNGSPQRSLVTALHVTFTEAMTFPDGLSNAIQLLRLNPTGPADVVNLNITGGGSHYDITFDDPVFAPGPTMSLIDGLYSLTLFASKIQGSSGPFHGGIDLVTNLHRLFGDADGSRSVNAQDFAGFRSVFGTGSSFFDENADGATNAADFAQFRARFGVSL